VSHTTRSPRANERDGHDYHFVSHEQFQALVDAGRFAEWAQVHGNFYGTSLDEIDRARADGKAGILFDIDYQGARQIKAAQPNAIGVFILPPSMSELHVRLRTRGSDNEDAIERRFQNARQEIEHFDLFDYVIVNDDLEQAKIRLRSIVYSERSRTALMADRARALLGNS
jgi:guanylate kinase